MPPLLLFILTSIGVFFVTDTDDLIVLLLLWLTAKTPDQRRSIVVGQYLGILTLMAISWGISWGLVTLNIAHWTHLLGIIPFTLGTLGLQNWYRTRKHDRTPTALPKLISPPLVWSLTLGNGGDNLSIYIPFFTHLNQGQLGIVLMVFIIMIGLWLFISYRLAKSTWARRLFTRFGAWLSPLLLVIVGIAILVQ
ncbi:cadmium resistance transporter [Levilactobacillus tangyuanensis]|uniref:Cadmium resistance transporter n=1 Tax=Levilactobacillus tangyuanensis TaxID=2486021 RepID=A0ABW1TJW6_9LACO|nr:cadmium resistance transporter [Levilactobacillus tangyuanensis]